MSSQEGGSDPDAGTQLAIATRMSIEAMDSDFERACEREADYQSGLHRALQKSLDGDVSAHPVDGDAKKPIRLPSNIHEGEGGDAAHLVTEAQAETQLQADLATAMRASLPPRESRGEQTCGSSSTNTSQILDEGYVCDSESSDDSASGSDESSTDDQGTASEDEEGLPLGPFSPPPKASLDPPCVSPAQPLCISFKPEHAQSGSSQKVRHPGRQKAVYPDGRNYRHAGTHHAKTTSPLFPTQLRLTDGSGPKLRKVRCDFEGTIDPGFMRKKCTYVSPGGEACGGCLMVYGNKGKLCTFINKRGKV